MKSDFTHEAHLPIFPAIGKGTHGSIEQYILEAVFIANCWVHDPPIRQRAKCEGTEIHIIEDLLMFNYFAHPCLQRCAEPKNPNHIHVV